MSKGPHDTDLQAKLLLGQSLSWGFAMKPLFVSVFVYLNCHNVIRPAGSHGGAHASRANKGALKSKLGSTRE